MSWLAAHYPIQESGTLSVAAVPEPSTWAMLALGFAALGFVGRRRQNCPPGAQLSGKSRATSNTLGPPIGAALLASAHSAKGLRTEN